MNPGDHVQNYRLERLLGKGGMGEVWLARQVYLDEPRALKVMDDRLAAEESFRERFMKEARAMVKLKHPHIVRAVDFFEEGGRFFLGMPYVEGGSLADRLDGARGPLPLPEALAVAGDTLGALDHAHRHGVIHRDVKPQNILLDGEGRAHLTDFGIALMMGDTRKTKTGVSIGTPDYMSPEQLTNPKGLDHRTDVYSLGCVLFEMVVGRPPFVADAADGDSDFLVKTAHVTQAPPRPSSLNGSLPAAVEAAILKALEKDPEKRFQGCGEFGKALEEARSGGASGQVRERPATEVEAPRPPETGRAMADLLDRWNGVGTAHGSKRLKVLLAELRALEPHSPLIPGWEEKIANWEEREEEENRAEQERKLRAMQTRVHATRIESRWESVAATQGTKEMKVLLQEMETLDPAHPRIEQWKVQIAARERLEAERGAGHQKGADVAEPERKAQEERKKREALEDLSRRWAAVTMIQGSGRLKELLKELQGLDPNSSQIAGWKVRIQTWEACERKAAEELAAEEREKRVAPSQAIHHYIPSPTKSKMAVASCWMSIVGIVYMIMLGSSLEGMTTMTPELASAFVVGYAMIFFGLVFGIVAMVRIRRDPLRRKGKQFAVAAILASSIWCAIALFALISS